MPPQKATPKQVKVRGQNESANSSSASLGEVIQDTLKLWKKHHLSYDQSKHVVEQVRKTMGLKPPSERRRTVDRLDTLEIERLIGAAYQQSSRQGLMVKTLFYTGTRVSEFVQIEVTDVHFDLEPPQVFIRHAKGGSDGYVPILPTLAQELRTHLGSRKVGYLFESNRSDRYSARFIQKMVKSAALKAGIEKQVTPHRLRASVATLLLDRGMPLEQVQKFLRHKRIATTQIYAQTSLRGMTESYLRALQENKA
ncbi:tyrosine-type recombinase/integrase [Deinococcus cellulosilyticus]|uniref:Tyr recombinase domain-containing protein n=1 Tax=Deinococcus cellulosilyticus (strain DSM 18568 / NBRC 106333 / KACC 11606 / 5516J-15) TaxID=1223518 RepID=A0A511NCD9_DEIC1|nr:tyrosine-type recombinase/integrase [Deinococcus cellulosilyticus]GEM50168.1 hypothetical protein DC3_58030 [Deinococcus cellulosilyticus NBRC 106333 = KACC 11606]